MTKKNLKTLILGLHREEVWNNLSRRLHIVGEYGPLTSNLPVQNKLLRP
jgi:hypothetical protein